jgi:hypothetical protein
MYRKLVFSLCLLLLSAAMAMAQDKGSIGVNEANKADGAADTDAKTLKGMSVLGNDEAPMSLFIVPWKSSELGVGTNLHRTLDERDVPVDRDVFMRELDFYQVSVGGNTPAPPAVSQQLSSR